jgi:hypothetical protein
MATARVKGFDVPNEDSLVAKAPSGPVAAPDRIGRPRLRKRRVSKAARIGSPHDALESPAQRTVTLGLFMYRTG